MQTQDDSSSRAASASPYFLFDAYAVSDASLAADLSATMMVGRLVFAAGMVGIIEASTMESPSTPWTEQRAFITASVSVDCPMQHVPTGW